LFDGFFPEFGTNHVALPSLYNHEITVHIFPFPWFSTTAPMQHPSLLFCPYLRMDDLVSFADWELGPLQSFEGRWADNHFKNQATTLLSKFVGPQDDRIDNPALLCKKGKQIDGQRPTDEEVRALRLSIAFATIDRNPRNQRENQHESWAIVTADNAELHIWPIDLEKGGITLTSGYLVKANSAGHNISDPKLVLRPPLDLHIPTASSSPDALMLRGVYLTVLKSVRSPGTDRTADSIRVAVEWFAKAWSNAPNVEWRERLVYLKTAFEAITGTSNSWKSARKLRKNFEALPHVSELDSKVLVWSPDEEPIHCRTWSDICGESGNILITDLQH
jgi:hypothetical protein